MSAPEPLPCPFCGDAPTITKQPAAQEVTGEWWFVSCKKIRSADCPANCWTGANSEAEAIARWNRRAK